jgi:hypothetical protein
MIADVCPPALVYLGFSLVQIIIDIVKNMYNTAMLKFIVMLIFTTILNILCQSGFTLVAWVIVFVPFILMTVITGLLLYVLGLSPTTGKLNYNVVELDGINNNNNNHSDKSNSVHVKLA